MAIKYDAELNNEIRRVVKNFNQKRKRAIRRGYSYLPNKVYVSDIKTNFESRADLKRYLKELEKFNKLKNSALETVETLGGGRTSRYNLMFLRDNLKDTKAFFDRQIAEAKELFYEDQYSMARRDYLFNLEAKRAYLDQNIMTLTQSGLKTFEKYTQQALRYNKSNVSAYKGFLSGVEQIMKQVGFDSKEINQFYEKMSNISPAQFIKMYRKHDVVGRIFDMLGSPATGKSSINTSDEDARIIIDKFMDDFGKMTQDVIDNKDEFEARVQENYNELLAKDNYSRQDSNRIKKSELTPKQIAELEALGWMDIVDENA